MCMSMRLAVSYIEASLMSRAFVFPSLVRAKSETGLPGMPAYYRWRSMHEVRHYESTVPRHPAVAKVAQLMLQLDSSLRFMTWVMKFTMIVIPRAVA